VGGGRVCTDRAIDRRRPRYVNYYRAYELTEAPLRAAAFQPLISRWSTRVRVEAHREYSPIRPDANERERETRMIAKRGFYAPKILGTLHLRVQGATRKSALAMSRILERGKV